MLRKFFLFSRRFPFATKTSSCQRCRTFCQSFRPDQQSVGAEDLDEESLSLLEEKDDFFTLVPTHVKPLFTGHNTLVIQPKEKYGKQKTELRSRTTPELQLEEAIALVHSLDGWNVAASKIISSKSSRYIFGSGQIDEIKDALARYNSKTGAPVSAIFISQDIIYGHIQANLEKSLGFPIFDRFSIVLQIFRQRAMTGEARLQLALAELYYVKTRLRQTRDESIAEHDFNIPLGSRHLTFEERKDIIKDREKKLKKAIERIREKRSQLRSYRKTTKIPTVAVVGYTNAGKTSLIQVLTKSDKLVPRDVLFATLDVRVLKGRLDTIHHVLFVDTIGFIADIPIALLESFKSVLEEILLADLIIHIQDVSHPDVKNQKHIVHKTLASLQLSDSLTSTMIELGNKADRLTEVKPEHREGVDLLISATKGINIDKLRREIEYRLFVNMGCFFKKLRVLTGGPEYQWIIRNAFIIDQEVDASDENFTIFTTKLTEANGGKFRKLFPDYPFFPQETSDVSSRDLIASR